MSILFESTKINTLEVPNRFVRSATGEGCADRAGHVTDTQIDIFAALADGGIGFIVTGISYVHPDGQISPTQTSCASDDCIPGLKKLTETVHGRGAKIAVQLGHTGRESGDFFQGRNKVPKGPSLVKDDPYFHADYGCLSEDDIWEIVGAFGDAAKRARESGFDGVQLHGAHAYLLSQFLSPFSNRREDDWGGSLENRIRLHMEILRDIRTKAGDDYPVLIKIGVQDGFPGGLELSEGKQAALLLANGGFDALEISQGLRGKEYGETEFRTKIKSVREEGYFRDWCREIKTLVNVPVMMVGGLRSFSLMEKVVENNEADFVSLCRPFIRQPGLVRDWQRGDRNRATCISCNQCLDVLKKGEMVRCLQEEKDHSKKR